MLKQTLEVRHKGERKQMVVVKIRILEEEGVLLEKLLKGVKDRSEFHRLVVRQWIKRHKGG